MRNTWWISMAAVAFLGACVFEDSLDGISDDEFGVTESEVDGLLAFMNDQDTTLERLDIDCAIRADSARNLIAHRDGDDAAPGSGDDDLFDSLDEIDGVRMVGPWTMNRLYECAIAFGYIEVSECLPEVFDASQPFDVEYVDIPANFDADLAAKVAELEADAPRYADPGSPYPVRFADVEIYTVEYDGTPVRYVVRFVQTIDLEGGIQLSILYWLDSCFEVLDVKTGI